MNVEGVCFNLPHVVEEVDGIAESSSPIVPRSCRRAVCRGKPPGILGGKVGNAEEMIGIRRNSSEFPGRVPCIRLVLAPVDEVPVEYRELALARPLLGPY